MLHKISLLDELRKGGYEASLITTFNAYLPFYEDVVLRRLVSAGVRHNVVMMDANQYARSLASHPPRLAGRNYTLLPIKVGGAFHPKLLFLAGKNKGLILVGSHNLTLAGFGFNRELTNLVRVENEDDVDGIALARDAWVEIDYWLEHFAKDVPGHLKQMVSRVRDFAPWINSAVGSNEDIRLLAGRPGAQPLWQQLSSVVGAEAQNVSVTGAFFDRELQFIERVNQDLRPGTFTVAVDPHTVELPPKARAKSDVSFVSADTLGVDREKEADDGRYLHAKGILVEKKNGEVIFASGSANPSAPAWLSSDASGNVELMLVCRGESAQTAAGKIGFDLVADMPPLNEGDWQAIKSNDEQRAEPGSLGYRSGVAIVDKGHINVDLSLLEGVHQPSFVLCASDGVELSHTNQHSVEGDVGLIKFSETELKRGDVLRVLLDGQLRLKLLLHHTGEVEEQARSGTQRRLKDALTSLETDTPNIELLIQCLDRIAFAEPDETEASRFRRVGAPDKRPTEERETSESLAVDVEDVKRRKSKKRLSHSGDFSYLLDALIYHLHFQDNRSVEEVDRFGRNEEEQVGADDDRDDNQEASQEQSELLDICHARVATVVNRMVNQLRAYASGQQQLDELLLRLLAVLAVLRELRKCDGRVSWVEKGKTTVPEKARLRLLEEVMFNLFEGELSFLHLEALGEDFQHSDDVARLKGLVLWLAWDCGLTMDLRTPFAESRDDLNKRLKRNAMVLALAQLVQSDDVVVDEARQSIGSLTSSEMGWLKKIELLWLRCKTIRDDSSTIQPVQTAEPGDIAIHKKLYNWDLRLVAQANSSRINLIKLSRGDEFLKYKPDHLGIARLK